MFEPEAARRLVQIFDNLDSLKITIDDLIELTLKSPLDSGQKDNVIVGLHENYIGIDVTLGIVRSSFVDWINTLIHNT